MTYCDSTHRPGTGHGHRCMRRPGHEDQHTCNTCGERWPPTLSQWEEHMETQFGTAVYAAQNRATLTAIALHSGMTALARRHAAEHHRWDKVALAISNLIEQETGK